MRFNFFPFPEYFLKNDEIIIEPLAQPDDIFGADHKLARGAITDFNWLPNRDDFAQCRCNQGP